MVVVIVSLALAIASTVASAIHTVHLNKEATTNPGLLTVMAIHMLTLCLNINLEVSMEEDLVVMEPSQ